MRTPSDVADSEGRTGVRGCEKISWEIHAEGRRCLKHKEPCGYWPWTSRGQREVAYNVQVAEYRRGLLQADSPISVRKMIGQMPFDAITER